MKVICENEKLKNAFTVVEKMTGKNLSLPALQSTLLIVRENSVILRATNLSIGIEISIPAKVEKEGVVLVRGDVVLGVLGNITTENMVTIEKENDNVTISTKKNKTTIKCTPHDDFPTIPNVEGESLEIKNSILQEGIRSVYFSAATTDIKPEIASIFIYTENNTIVFVATDSFRLSEKKIQFKKNKEISKLLIPYKNINDILRVLDLFDEEEIKITFSRNQIAISGKGVYFTSRIIDGAFPDYKLILPKEEKTKIVLMKQELLSTLRISTMFTDKFSQINLVVKKDNKNIIISSKNSDVGSSESFIDAVIQGQDIEVSCNLRYFLDVFQSIQGDSLSISFTEPTKPIVIKSVSDNSFIYLLMPTNR